MAALPKVIQGLILFSTVLGLVFLWQALPVLPADVFGFVAFGWALFAIDSALTFVRPKASYYLGLVLAFLALYETLSQPAHFALVAGGNLLASATIVLGVAAEALLIVSAAYYILLERRRDSWAWPGTKAQA